MTDDLVKRLLEYRVGCGFHCEAYDAREPLDECIEAADRIEKLEAALVKVAEGYEIEWSKSSVINMLKIAQILSERIVIARNAMEGVQ
jgi:hypothetical protein